MGQRVRQRIDLARQSVARLVGADPADLTFTSGGTESANLAIYSALRTRGERRVFATSRVEHSAVKEMFDRIEADGCEVIWLENDDAGVVGRSRPSKNFCERAATRSH